MSSKFGEIRPWTAELAALERLKKIPQTYNGENDVIFLRYFSSDPFHTCRTCIEAWMSSKFGQI